MVSFYIPSIRNTLIHSHTTRRIRISLCKYRRDARYDSCLQRRPRGGFSFVFAFHRFSTDRVVDEFGKTCFSQLRTSIRTRFAHHAVAVISNKHTFYSTSSRSVLFVVPSSSQQHSRNIFRIHNDSRYFHRGRCFWYCGKNNFCFIHIQIESSE